METAEQGMEDNACVSSAEFEVEMRKIFGEPIGSSAASKVLSDDRCDACFEYLMKLEEKERAYNEYKASNDRLRERGIKKAEEIDSAVSAMKLAQGSENAVSEDVKKDILLRAAAYSTYTTVVEKLKQNDDKKAEDGSKIHGRWGRYIKDAVGRGKSRRLFIQKQPSPGEGLPPKYTLVASKGGLGATVLDVVKPGRWYEVLLQVHSEKNHAGRDKIFAAVKEQYWNVPKFAIDRFSKLCQARQQKNLVTPVPHSLKVEKATPSDGFLSRLQLVVFSVEDFVQNSPFKHVCCITDLSTQFVQMWSMERAAGAQAAANLVSFMLRFGGAHMLHLQNGPQFEVEVMDALARIWDYPIVLGAELVENSYAVGLAQQFLCDWFNNRSRSDQDKRHWEAQLERVAYAVNCTVHKAKGKTPHECVFGQKPRMGPVFPGLNYGVIRETFGRSYVLERELEANTKSFGLAHRQSTLSDISAGERLSKWARPDQSRPARKRTMEESSDEEASGAMQMHAKGEASQPSKYSRGLEKTTKSAVEELAEKRSSRGSSKSDDMMTSMMKA